MNPTILLQTAALFLTIVTSSTLYAQTPALDSSPRSEAIVLEVENVAQLLRFGGSQWAAAKTNQVLNVRDRFRTGFKSRATLMLSNRAILRVRQLTTLEIQSPSDPTSTTSILDLQKGAAYFFNREEPVETQFRTPQASGAIRGTEFNIEVADNGRTVVTLLDGEVDLTNELGQVSLVSGEQGIVEPGQAPTKTAVLNAINIIQWGLYYPGVLDLSELGLNADSEPTLHDSLTAYRQGDLLQAVALYPTNRVAATALEHLYSAALSLAVGEVDEAEMQLAQVESSDSKLSPLADALRQLIAAVNFQIWSQSTPPGSASEWMAESYYQQSRSNLNEALQAAQNAAKKSPNFGFAWSRVAEMEFSFGRTDAALDALDKSLQLSPRNAQALALKGFLLAAQNKMDAALDHFDQAIAIDGALSNAWLGRGLCKIRRGNAEAGRQDLQVAATLEPHRAVLRSYLGKAFNNSTDTTNAAKELGRAKQLDPNDPTSWLYSALLNQQGSSINEAIRDLEKSQALNDNRRLYRSRMLLDQDRAVRGANLAGIYQDAKMLDVSFREASRAVNSDYANYSAHLFLANSYNALRDPRQISLRYETAWLSEFLLSNLLAPVGAGTLSQYVSQQEYSRLFQQDRFGLSSSTEYLSGGDWTQAGSQFGTFGNTSYALDSFYATQNGQRPNEDMEQLTLSAKFKQQLTPQDSVYFQSIYYDFESGDVTQYYDQTDAHSGLRVREEQEPILIAGYHHEWAPGNHSLVLFSRMDDTLRATDPDSSALFIDQTQAGEVIGVSALPSQLDYRSDFEAYSTEIQQIFQRERQSLILGGRYQTGTFDTQSQFETASIESDLERLSAYAYDNWRLADPLLFTVGLAYDRLSYPVNHRVAPISSGERTKDQVSPKAGLTWTPTDRTVVRGGYSRSLGGVSFDQSFRLEPTQIAGFNQAYRSIIPESIAGSLEASEFETFGLGLDHKFTSGTYAGIKLELLQSDVDRTLGAVDSIIFPPDLRLSSTPQQLDYQEKNAVITVNQLVGQNWSLGARYRLSDVDLRSQFTAIPTSVTPAALTDENGILHELKLYGLFNHRSGAFGLLESVWFQQSNRGSDIDKPGDDFWHFNAFVGYRFFNRSAELKLGVLNIADQDYRLNPLNLYSQLRRERTLSASFKFYY